MMTMISFLSSPFLSLTFSQDVCENAASAHPPPSASTHTPLCPMAFYSYVMIKTVRVGIEAILQVAREQHDRRMTGEGVPHCELDDVLGD